MAIVSQMRPLFLLLLLAACPAYKPATTTPTPVAFTVSTARAATAERVTQFLAAQGIAVSSADSTLVTARDIALPLERLKQWVDCGTVNGAPAVEHRNAVALTGTGNLSVSLRSTGTGTEVTPTFAVSVTAPTPIGSTRQQCVSSGKMEAALRATLH